MKKLATVFVALMLAVLPISAERINAQYTITAGTPIRLYGISMKVDRLFLQSRHSNTGLIYLMAGVATSKTCNASDTSQLTAELGPGDATHPGNAFSDPQGANGTAPPDFEDLQNFCVDGTHSGDVVIVSFWHRT